ncbi:pyridoxal phosphate phosphatase [Histomonas meleagridis]|uniref:pyridoxal phosphate phosphatase n=1 Tax=Histomonas meleagridis TaxID=135588 RepID=UPI0035594464|nr:pyridoxal phosphate phosphatase [Histomonas meleagridis]KAH0802299.1 pyridoxal phosphate phosphatase [Histomonas meleagridis]
MDGVLWTNEEQIPGAVAAIENLQKAGFKTFVITNNSSDTREQISKKLYQIGFHSITQDTIVSSGYITAHYLISKGFLSNNKKVFVVGESGLKKELLQNGINALGEEDFPDKSLSNINIDKEISAVVVGFDSTLTYRKLGIGNRIIVENDAILIGTNCDKLQPIGNGMFVPDALPIIMALETSSGKKAVILGKPSEQMIFPLEKSTKMERSEMVMVGDNLFTDIKFAKNIGARSVLVMTGVTSKDDLLKVTDSCYTPDYVIESVALIPDLINKINEKNG